MLRQSKMENNVFALIQNTAETGQFNAAIEEQVNERKLTKAEIREAIIKGWSRGVDKCLEDGIIDKEEEKALVTIKNGFHFTEEELDQHGANSRLMKALVLRDVMEGILPRRIQLAEPLPINLQKGEAIVWAFTGCEYWEDKTKRSFQGGSRGVSVKVMKGVYYRVGAFNGSPVYSTERVLVDRGVVYMTNNNIYFSGPSKSLRMPYSKIVSFEPFEDGIGIMRDAQTAKAQIFKTGDGWFAYNLITNLAQAGIQA